MCNYLHIIYKRLFGIYLILSAHEFLPCGFHLRSHRYFNLTRFARCQSFRCFNYSEIRWSSDFSRGRWFHTIQALPIHLTSSAWSTPIDPLGSVRFLVMFKLVAARRAYCSSKFSSSCHQLTWNPLPAPMTHHTLGSWLFFYLPAIFPKPLTLALLAVVIFYDVAFTIS